MADASVPNTITGPATVNILAAMPVTNPSLLKSMAGDTTALAKPVMGTSVPAPPKRASLLYRLKPVSSADSSTRQTEVAVPASSLFSPMALQPFWMACPTTQISPPMTKASTTSLTMGDFFAFCST